MSNIRVYMYILLVKTPYPHAHLTVFFCLSSLFLLVGVFKIFKELQSTVPVASCPPANEN